MFLDYYNLLGIHSNATSDDIKAAFRKEIKKYHDDTNMGEGDNERTIQLIEAKYILLDEEARKKYDEEYRMYNIHIDTEQNLDYEIQDKELEKWIQNAKEQAKKMYKEMIEELKDSSKKSSNAMLNFIKYLLPFLIGFFLFKMCSAL